MSAVPRGLQMAVQFLLYLMTILLVLIFWELSKIHTRIKKALTAANDHTLKAKEVVKA
jgi:hypothetical protein